MKRRTFIQSLTAVLSLPAFPTLSLQSATAVLPTAAVVPAQARSWAVYISTLHGECPPQALQTMLNIPAADAKNYVTQLIADGIIKPNPLLQKSVSRFVKTNEDSFRDKFKKRLEMKAQADSEEVEVCKKLGENDCLDSKTELLDNFAEIDQEDIVEDEIVETESHVLDDAKVQD